MNLLNRGEREREREESIHNQSSIDTSVLDHIPIFAALRATFSFDVELNGFLARLGHLLNKSQVHHTKLSPSLPSVCHCEIP